MSKIGVYNNKLGIGSTSPSTLVHIESDPPTGQPLLSNSIITLKNSDTGFRTEGSHSSLIHFSMGTDDDLCKIKGTHHGNTGDGDYSNKRGRVEFITHNGTNHEMLLSLVNDGTIKYLNLDSTNHGTSGYGIRDNDGTLQYKNSGGSWANITSGGGGTTITGAATTIDTENLTVSRALVSDTNGKVAVSTTTSTELGHVSGVTSAIQAQLNGKQSTLTAGTGVGIAGSNISIGQAVGTTNNVTFNNIAGTLTTAAQTNITSVGTLSTLVVSGNGGILTVRGTSRPNIRYEKGSSLKWQVGMTSETNENFSIDNFDGNDDLILNLSGGDVGIGDSSPSSKLDVNGKITCTDFQNTSDRRIKENIIPATDVAIMSNLDNLNLKVYTYTEEYRKSLPPGSLPTNPVFGWIAQEVKNTYSDAIVVQKNTIGETEYDDFHYIKKGKLYDLAVAGVKILHQKIKDLENRIKVLESK
tara:strand:+ start:1305 stop:2714 length:1410 start_codon:yes stop_codon:yes gene_type:complete